MVRSFSLLFLLLLMIYNCNSGTNTADCNDCGGGLTDGFLYKEVSLEDVVNLTEIGLSVNIGQCIRFKMDGTEFLDAMIVDECCCSLY